MDARRLIGQGLRFTNFQNRRLKFYQPKKSIRPSLLFDEWNGRDTFVIRFRFSHDVDAHIITLVDIYLGHSLPTPPPVPQSHALSLEFPGHLNNLFPVGSLPGTYNQHKTT